MAAIAEIIVQAKVTDLGDQKLFSEKFNDGTTPGKVFHGYTPINSVAVLVSTICKIPTAQMLGVAIKAVGSVLYFNTVSTTVSTKGGYIPTGQAVYISLKPGNTGKLTFVATAAATSVANADFIIYGKVT